MSLVEPLRPEWPIWRTDAGGGLPVHEVDDALPRVALLLVPQPRATRGDPALRRDAGHLGHHQPGAAEGLGAEVDQVELGRDTVLGDVHVHRGEDDPVLEGQVADLGRLEHGRRDLGCALVAGELGLHARGEVGVAVLEVLEGDAARPGDQVEDELGGVLVGVHADVLEPLQRGLGRSLGRLDHRLALGLVGLERRPDRRVLVQAGSQGQRVLHGQLGPGADREVRGVGGVAEQHHVAVVPALVADGVEVEPLGVVGEDPVTLELVGEDVGDPLDGVVVRDAGREDGVLGAVEAGAAPDVFVHLHDEGGAGVGVGVAVDLHGSPLRLLDEELERLEDQVGAEPDVLVVAAVQGGPEAVGVPRADRGVEPVRGHHEVVPGAQLVGVGRLGAEVHRYPELGHALLQDAEQVLAAHGGEPLAADRERVPVDLHVDVGPAREVAGHLLVDHGVCGLHGAEGLVGEHDTEAEGVVGRVALPHGDLVALVELFHQGGEVEAARAAAGYRDPHEWSPPDVRRWWPVLQVRASQGAGATPYLVVQRATATPRGACPECGTHDARSVVTTRQPPDLHAAGSAAACRWRCAGGRR
jgi:hypothetical protein